MSSAIPQARECGVYTGPAAPPPTPDTRARFEPLAVTSWALMANTVATSALGVAFWAVASRLYPPRQLGEDAALISAMMLLSAVSQVNLSMGIPRLLPQVRGRRWRPVLGAYGLTAVVATILTLGFVHAAPRISGGFAFLDHDRGVGLTLVVAVVLWNVFALQDAVLTSARWAPVIPFENGLFGLLKIGLIVGLSRGFGAHGVFLGWVLAMAILVLPVNALIFWRVLPARRDEHRVSPATALPLERRDRVARYLAADYAAALLGQGATALLPVLVLGVLGRADNAYFYVAFLIAAAVGALSHSLGVALLVEGAHDESNVVTLARRSLTRYVRFVVPSVALLVIGAPLVLMPFGHTYVEHGTPVLRLLLAGTVAQAVISIYLGVERVRARARRVVAVEAATVLLVVAGGVVGMRRFGLVGMGGAWLIAQATVAVIVAPSLWRVLIGAEPQRRTQFRPAGTAVTHQRRPRVPWVADVVDLATASATSVLLLLAGLGATGTLRLALGVVFVTFIPGWAVSDHVALASGASRVAVAVALSLSLTTIAALSSLWLHLWRPLVLLDVSGALCLAAIVRHLAGGGADASATARGPSRARAPA